MQTSSIERIGGHVPLRSSLGFGALAVVVLSFGIGAATAAFSMIDGSMPHTESYSTCDTAASFDGHHLVMIGMDGGPMLSERVSDVYETSFDAANDGLDVWSDAAASLGDRSTIIVLSAAALALLVACANAARSVYARSGRSCEGAGTQRVALVAIGALSFAALLLRLASTTSVGEMLGSTPVAHIGARAIVFAICISALVEARRRLLPRLS